MSQSQSSSAEWKEALTTTEAWIQYMERRIAVLRSRKAEWAAKLEKMKQDRMEVQTSLVEKHLSDWNRACLVEMARGAGRALPSGSSQAS